MNKPKKKKKANNEIETFDYMKTNKDNIKNVIKDDAILPKINSIVNTTNKIVIHAYQFLKLYLIHLYEKNLQFPELDKEYICDIFKVLTDRKCKSGGYSEAKMPEQLRTLKKFYDEHYSHTVIKDEILYYDKLSYILAYEAIDMITNINNNIQEHFIDHLNKYVNIVFSLKDKRVEITRNTPDKEIRKALHKQLYEEFNKIKKDLISLNSELISNEEYHQWITEEKAKLFPNKIKFDNDSIFYDLKSNTQYYLISMFHICNEMEKINDTNKDIEEFKQIRLFNVLPLRTNIIGKNICIDTCGLISNFLENEPTSKYLSGYKKEANMQFDLWNIYFRLNKRVFKKGSKYAFNYMIRTDGISCCILFVRVDASGKPLPKSYLNKKCCNEENIKYIEHTEITNELKNMKVVVADPLHKTL